MLDNGHSLPFTTEIIQIFKKKLYVSKYISREILSLKSQLLLSSTS